MSFGSVGGTRTDFCSLHRFAPVIFTNDLVGLAAGSDGFGADEFVGVGYGLAEGELVAVGVCKGVAGGVAAGEGDSSAIGVLVAFRS